MRFIKQMILAVGVLLSIEVQAVDNPVSVVLKGTPLLYAGDWYGLSGRTNGAVLSSSNLMDWKKVGQALNPRIPQIQDWVYRNGLVYLYVQDKGYAISLSPTNSFSSLHQLKVSGENLTLFEPPSGELFALFRHKGSGNRLGVQRWRSPIVKGGSFRKTLTADIGLWDAFDSVKLENPSAYYYRGRTYYLYAANYPSPRTAKRVIGVASSSSILKMDNFDKQREPLLRGNLDRMEEVFKPILPTGENAPWRGRYLLKKPKEENWTEVDCPTTAWRGDDGGFGFPLDEDDARILSLSTSWKKNEIWIRREFELNEAAPQTPVLAIRHEGPVVVFLNGKQIYISRRPHPSYGFFPIPYPPKSCFLKGKNVLAVYASARPKDKFRGVDFGLFDAKDQKVEPVVIGMDSPRIVDGINGFEKWIFYNAWWNGLYGTGLDRVFFYGKKMVVDGPTTSKTAGFHPAPTPPTFKSNFSSSWETHWKKKGTGDWLVENGGLSQTNRKARSVLLLQEDPAQNYLFETQLNMDEAGSGSLGVVAYDDGDKRLFVRIHPKKGMWDYQIIPSNGGAVTTYLPQTFKWSNASLFVKRTQPAWHRLRIVKNGGNFEVFLDAFNLTLHRPIQTNLKGKGVPGLLVEHAKATFKNVIYTKGWDEYGGYMTGWASARDGTPKAGEWSRSWENGLEQKSEKEIARVFKGDLLDGYEFTVQARIDKIQKRMKGEFGVFPLFVDKENYLKVVVNTKERTAVLSGKLKGRPLAVSSKLLSRKILLYSLFDKYNDYRDTAAWVFQLPSASIISGLNIWWLEGKVPFLGNDFILPTDEALLRYAHIKPLREPLGWEDNPPLIDIGDPKSKTQKSGVFNPITFNPVIGNYIGMGFYLASSFVVNTLTDEVVGPYEPGMILMPWETMVLTGGEGETDSFPQKVAVDVEMESSYFFRCVKLKDRVIIELNGMPMFDIKGDWGPAQVGLFTKNQACSFDGITVIHHPLKKDPISKKAGKAE